MIVWGGDNTQIYTGPPIQACAGATAGENALLGKKSVTLVGRDQSLLAAARARRIL